MEKVQTIVACGAGASTKLIVGDGRIERYIAPKDVKTYIGKIDEIIEGKRKTLEITVDD